MSGNISNNLLTNLMVLLLSIIINLLMTPFYIKYTGVDGLGILRLALIIPMYIGLVTIIINGAVSRFLTINIHDNDFNEANITFNTAFFSLSTILVALIPFVFIIILNLPLIINIPGLLIEDAKLLFLSIFFSSQIIVFSTLFLIPAFANNRLDIQNYIKICILFIQTSIVIFAFIFMSPNIKYIGFGYVIAAMFGLILSIIIVKKMWPYLKLNIRFFKISKLKELSSFGSWMFVNQVGSILFLYIDLLLINHYFGSEATGEYSIALQWSVLFRSLASSIASVLGPIIMIAYAGKKYQEIIEKSKFSVKYMGITLALMIGVFLGFSEIFLSLWLGEEFIRLVPLLWLMLSHLVINLAVLPLFFINTAYNKVKIPGILSLIFGFINLLLVIILIDVFNYNFYAVAMASAIILTIKNFIFIPLYTAHILKISIISFYKYITYGLFTFFFSITVSSIISMIDISTWFALFFFVAVSLLIIISFIWIVQLNNIEKSFLQKKLKWSY